MKVTSPTLGEVVFEGEGGFYTVTIPVDGTALLITVFVDDEVEDPDRSLRSFVEMLPGLLAAGPKALERNRAEPSEDYGVAMYIEHSLEEVPESVWQDLAGNSAPSAEEAFNLIRLVGASVVQDGYRMDYSLGKSVTDYVVCVEFDDTGTVTGVVVES